MTNSISNLTRLNKYLALTMGLSRRQADDLIAEKKVTINGKFAELGARFQTGDKILIDGQPVIKDTKFQYLAMNKPVGYVCSRRQQGTNPTIYDLLPAEYHHLKTVGRLDRDSSGLILLTNDGDFTFQMTHPSFYKTKVYNVRLDKGLQPLHQQMICDYGVSLVDGPSKLQVEKQSEGDNKNWVVTMHEGRNRQIRRTFESLGYQVLNLHRTNFGNYSVGDIKPGKYKIIDIH